MKKLWYLLALVLAAGLVLAACGTAATTGTTGTTAGSAKDSSGGTAATTPAGTADTAGAITTGTKNEEIAAMREQLYADYVAAQPATRARELVKNGISYVVANGRRMKVQTKVWGTKPETGYPIFIVLHGGGTDPTGEINESQWSGMAGRYANHQGAPGIYIACRAIEDTWNCHSVDNAYAFYDRIIADAVMYLSGDPNRVYLVGYSAGGDGVYQIAPRMADRFAAANMTAGHPNGISFVNLYHLPFFLQVGELDTAYSRNTVTVESSEKLDALAKGAGGGYLHAVFVHVGKEHGVVGDNATIPQRVVDDTSAWRKAGGASGVGGTQTARTHAALLMSAYTRDPLPTRVIWDLSTRTPAARKVTSFYWLSAPATVNSGTLDISYDRATNTVTVNNCSVRSGRITVYLNEAMVDFDKPVTFVYGETRQEISLTVDENVMEKTLKEREDLNYVFAASFTFNAANGTVLAG